MLLTVGALAPFPQDGESFGGSISRTNNTTFTVSDPGYYRIDFILPTGLVTLLGGAEILVNGGVVPGSAASLLTAGTQLSGMALVELGAGDTIQVRVTGLALTLASGSNLMITQLSSTSP